jgi:hypothetical protein
MSVVRGKNPQFCKSTASSTEPALAKQAVSAPQPQNLPLQQDPFWGTRFPHTIEPKGQGYIGRGAENPVVGVQDPLMYNQQLFGAQGYGDQIKPSEPNKYGSRSPPLQEAYVNHVAGARGDEPIPHPSQDKGFGVLLQFINQLVGYLGSGPYSVQDPKDRKSYPPASRLVHKINLRDPRQTRPDGTPSIYHQHRASYQESDPQRIDQGREPPLRPMYPGNTFENHKPPFSAECVPGPKRSLLNGIGFREPSPVIQPPRRSKMPSFMNSCGASERFPSPDIRPILGQEKYFGRPVGPQPFGPTEARGTKRPHPDESGQSPPLTGIAKRMKTTIRYREIIM